MLTAIQRNDTIVFATLLTVFEDSEGIITVITLLSQGVLLSTQFATMLILASSKDNRFWTRFNIVHADYLCIFLTTVLTSNTDLTSLIVQGSFFTLLSNTCNYCQIVELVAYIINSPHTSIELCQQIISLMVSAGETEEGVKEMEKSIKLLIGWFPRERGRPLVSNINGRKQAASKIREAISKMDKIKLRALIEKATSLRMVDALSYWGNEVMIELLD
jgi:hypothetical protein